LPVSAIQTHSCRLVVIADALPQDFASYLSVATAPPLFAWLSDCCPHDAEQRAFILGFSIAFYYAVGASLASPLTRLLRGKWMWLTHVRGLVERPHLADGRGAGEWDPVEGRKDGSGLIGRSTTCTLGRPASRSGCWSSSSSASCATRSSSISGEQRAFTSPRYTSISSPSFLTFCPHLPPVKLSDAADWQRPRNRAIAEQKVADALAAEAQYAGQPQSPKNDTQTSVAPVLSRV
jgi:hypothetical protein